MVKAKIPEPPKVTFERFFYTDAEYHSTHPMLYHRHKEFTEIIYVIEGTGSYKVDNRMYELKPGNVIIVDQSVWHGEEPFLNEQSVTYTCAMKIRHQDGTQVESMIRKNQRAVYECEPGCALEHIFHALYEVQKEPVPDRELCSSLSDMILRLTQKIVQGHHDEDDRTSQKNDELVRIITEYLDENYAEAINLKDLGERFHLNHYYLAHIFKEETGVSPIKYVMHRKIGEVQNRLMNTNDSIQDIGEAMGFSSSCHLSSVFKKYFGISPKVYRQNFKESDRAGYPF